MTAPQFQALRQYLRYRPATRVGRAAYRVATVSILMFVPAQAFHAFHALGMVLFWCLSAILVPLPLWLVLRAINKRLLWKVRNRLILTHLLMGLAPVVLFGTITGLTAYIFAGQYATNTALSYLDDTERHVGGETNIAAVSINTRGDIPKAEGNAASYGASDSARTSLVILDGGT